MSSRATRNIKGIIFNEATKEKMIKKTLETISPFLKFSPDLALEETNKVYNIFGKDFPKFEPVLKIIIQNRFELGCINVIYTNLSFITQGHESSTRYPEINNSPLTIYTQHHPLIRRFNALTRLAGIAHRKFDNILSSSEKLQKNNVPSTNFSTPP
jgi:hypothetical protein